jgi:hypothetical protein
MPDYAGICDNLLPVAGVEGTAKVVSLVGVDSFINAFKLRLQSNTKLVTDYRKTRGRN